MTNDKRSPNDESVFTFRQSGSVILAALAASGICRAGRPEVTFPLPIYVNKLGLPLVCIPTK
jgi:hypothetical protein